MTPKQALIKDGKVKVSEGRGRLSREAKARVLELVADGWQIDGYTVEKPTKVNKDSNATPAPVVKAHAPNVKTVADYVEFYPEGEYTAEDQHGKTVSMREVCRNCGVSLVQDSCGSPVVVGDRHVKIARLTR